MVEYLLNNVELDEAEHGREKQKQIKVSAREFWLS